MEIAKVLTPPGIQILKYFIDKTEYHFASIKMVADNTNYCYITVRKSLVVLAQAGVLNACPTGKMILYMRNPNSEYDFIAAFQALAAMIEK
ncbi:MAG: hypothetical protein ACNYVW_03520 [Methanosarcinales archaeon]